MDAMEKIPVTEYKLIEEGIHSGEIVEVVRRKPTKENTYDYTDYIIEEADTLVKLKAGFPTTISFDSKGEAKSLHAEFLKRMGITLKLGEEFDPQTLVHSKVVFQVMNKENKGKTFSNIIRETVKAQP